MSDRTPAPRVERQEPDESMTVARLAQIVDGLNRPDRRDQLRALLGSDAAVDRFITVTLHALSGNRNLLAKCSPVSILETVREAATLDLEPTGLLGEAWIVPHKGRAVLRIGWRGFLKLIRRSERIAAVDTQVVFEHDEFELELGTNPHIYHRPSLGDRGGYKGAYAWARTSRGGELIIEWMNVADIEQVRAVSEAKNAFAWSDWWTEMARKSVVRRLAKRLPLATIAEHALAVDEEADKIESGEDAPVREARRRTLALLAGENPDKQADDSGITEDEMKLIDAAVAKAGRGEQAPSA